MANRCSSRMRNLRIRRLIQSPTTTQRDREPPTCRARNPVLQSTTRRPNTEPSYRYRSASASDVGYPKKSRNNNNSTATLKKAHCERSAGRTDAQRATTNPITDNATAPTTTAATAPLGKGSAHPGSGQVNAQMPTVSTTKPDSGTLANVANRIIRTHPQCCRRNRSR